MTNYSELTSALEDKSLTDALQRIEHFAANNGFTELETWCKQELGGYAASRADLPSYRIGEVQWIDDTGRNISEQYDWSRIVPGLGMPGFPPPVNIPIVNGVAQLERESREDGFAIVKTSVFRGAVWLNTLRINYGRLPTSEVNNIFDNIRLEARRRLNSVSLEQSVTAVRYPTPEFDQIIKDDKLTQILEQRWVEAIAIYDVRAYLTTIVSLGAILEGVLFAQVTQNPEAANTTAGTPKSASGKPLPLKEWTLDELIQVSHSCGWLKKGIRDFLFILRDYRNLVHPREQLRKDAELSQGTCNIAWEVVSAAVADITAAQSAR